MKKIFLACITLLAAATAQAQEVKTFEVEARVGATLPIDECGLSSMLGPQLGLEARWNLLQLPVDVGGELYVGSAVRDAGFDDLSHRTIALSAVAHYNFNRGSKVSPFVGMGLGVADLKQVTSISNTLTDKTRIAFSPRVGVELWNHVRITLDIRVASKEYNTVGLSIGAVFGGGRK